jgi:hypothetical protein
LGVNPTPSLAVHEGSAGRASPKSRGGTSKHSSDISSCPCATSEHIFQPAYISPACFITSADIFVHIEISRLGKRLQIRQQAMATAQLYVRRFYTKVEIRMTNPYLVLATAVYLACKMEECPQHIRLVVSEARSLWPGRLNLSLDAATC